ncbi:MAG: hypothetical protein R2878_03330 [Thermoleophilia bacterium]
MPGMVRRPSRLVGLIVAVAVVVVGVLLWQRAGRSTEVPVASAVGDFRAGGGGGSEPGAPTPGVYSYRATGTERGTVGPLNIDRAVPPTARAVVRSTTRGFSLELRISEEHVEETRFVRAPRGLLAVWRRVDVRFLGIGRDDRRPLVPPVLTVPSASRVGASWDSSFRTWKLSTAGRARVVRATTLSVGGTSYPVVVLEDRGRTSGAHGGPRLQRWWWSEQLKLPIRIESDVTLGGVFGYRSKIRLDLASATPAR